MTVSSEKVNISDLNRTLQHFSWIDYVIFLLMLIVSALIGIYFGFVEKKTKRKFVGSGHESEVAKEYLMGGRKMSAIPVAFSLVARYIYYFPIISENRMFLKRSLTFFFGNLTPTLTLIEFRLIF